MARINGKARGFASRDGVSALTSTAGAARTLTDTAGAFPTGASVSLGKGAWLYLPTAAAADQRRLIQSYDGALRQYTHEGPDYSAPTIAALATGLPYLVLLDDPDLWNSALNEALRTLLSSIHYDEFVPTGVATYVAGVAPFAALVGVSRAAQILDIEQRATGDAVGAYDWTHWADSQRTWRAYDDEGTVVIDFGQPLAVPSASGVTLRVKWADQYATVSDETTTIAVDEDMAAYALLAQMGDWLAQADNPADDWRYLRERATIQLGQRRRQILGPDAYRNVTRTTQHAGLRGVRGRGGR